MINELHQLKLTLQEAGMDTESWYREYLPIPSITKKAPCIRIVLDGDRVAEIESVAAEKWTNIRKFGNNHGAFPAMNLVALYRITDETAKKEIAELIDSGGEIDLERIQSWCKTDNWTPKFRAKYRRSVEDRTDQLLQMLQEENAYKPLADLIEAVEPFKNPEVLHERLKTISFEMLQNRSDTVTALQVLFYLPTSEKEDSGSLSVVLDTFDLEDAGVSTVGPRFAKDLNHALLRAEAASKEAKETSDAVDAFCRPYLPLSEPMPTVRLAAGFEVSLRTMFHAKPCQYRYGRIEDETYPISKEERNELSAALYWLSRKEQRNKTWVSTDKEEALFVFPSKLKEDLPSFTDMFQGTGDASQGEALFEAKAKDFTEYITKTKERDPEHCPEWMQFFVLRKVDRARTKTVYSYNAGTEEILQRSDEWQKAAKNLPAFYFGAPWVPFPLKLSKVLNIVWKQDGTTASGKSTEKRHKEVSSYYGMELFFRKADLTRALRILLRNAVPLGMFAGSRLNANTRSPIDNITQLHPLKETLALLGMLLYWKNIRKDEYMNEYPYLFGQLLKAADGLHELYCMIERDKQVPPQLIGSSMYQSAMEYPKQALAQLGKRLQPYLAWAKTHLDASFSVERGNGETGNSPNARYFLYVFSEIAKKLSVAFTEQTRFSDAEKAQLFIGYLASFPKREKAEQQQNMQKPQN